jgi:hypothetical protein
MTSPRSDDATQTLTTHWLGMRPRSVSEWQADDHTHRSAGRYWLGMDETVRAGAVIWAEARSGIEIHYSARAFLFDTFLREVGRRGGRGGTVMSTHPANVPAVQWACFHLK